MRGAGCSRALLLLLLLLINGPDCGLLLLQEACHVLLPLLNFLLLLLESCHSCKHTSKLRHMGWLCWQACCTLVHN